LRVLGALPAAVAALIATVFSLQLTVIVQVTGEPTTVEQDTVPPLLGNSANKLVPQFFRSNAAICAGVHTALVKGYGLNHGQFAKDVKWQEAYDSAFEDFISNFGAEWENLGLREDPRNPMKVKLAGAADRR